MIIDTHVHMYDGNWPPDAPKGLSTEQMLEAMDQCNVEKSWISPVSGLVKDYKKFNNWLYDFTKHNENRFVRFYTVSPHDPDHALDEIKRCVEMLGCQGIKLHPWLQAFSTSISMVSKITEACIRYNLPILYHDGTPPYSDSLQIANLAEKYPEAKVILGHAGLYDLYRNAIAASKRYKNIYLCICGPAIEDTRQIVNEIDHDRLIYGSDFGTLKVETLAERIKVVEYAIDDEGLKRKILYDNAEAILKK